jgi:hypothetical protein
MAGAAETSARAGLAISQIGVDASWREAKDRQTIADAFGPTMLARRPD